MVLESIDIRRATIADRDGVEALFQDVFGEARPPETYDWLFYQGAPNGISIVAETEGKIVGHVGTMSRTVLCGAEEVVMATSVDSMTHPGWQKRGINKLLSRRLIEENKAEGAGVFGGFSNENSSHTVVQHQQRQSLGSIPLLVRPLRILTRPWRILGASPEPISSSSVQWPDDLKELCANQSIVGIGTRRSHEYLHWRYQCPGASYHCVELRSGDVLQGLGVLGLRHKGGLKLGFVMEILTHRDFEGGDRKVLKALVKKAKELGCDGLCALGFSDSDQRQTFKGSAFVPIKPGLLGERINFSVRALNEALHPIIMEKKSWYLTWGDTDLV